MYVPLYTAIFILLLFASAIIAFLLALGREYRDGPICLVVGTAILCVLSVLGLVHTEKELQDELCKPKTQESEMKGEG